jgi:ABC-type transport system substrate-binding protein
MQFLAPRRWLNYGEFYHGQMAGLGITLELKLLDEAAYEAARLTLDYETQHGGTSGSPIIPEATQVYFDVYSKSKVGRTKHEDPRIAEWFRQLNATSVLEERVRVWRQLERHWLLEQVYSVPVAGDLSVIPYSSRIKGMVVPPERVHEYLDFSTLWLER